MFASIMRLLGGRADSAGRDRKTIVAWAADRGLALKHAKDAHHGEGLVVESPVGWRMEWGRSQRSYLLGQEIRFRCDSGIHPDTQVLFLTKALAHLFETAVFSRFTHAMQTQVDHTLPEEMRWLAMHPKINMGEVSELTKRFTLLSNVDAWVLKWLSGPQLKVLSDAAQSWWNDQIVAVITLNRGVLTLRFEGKDLDPQQLTQAQDLYETLLGALKAVGSPSFD